MVFLPSVSVINELDIEFNIAANSSALANLRYITSVESSAIASLSNASKVDSTFCVINLFAERITEFEDVKGIATN